MEGPPPAACPLHHPLCGGRSPFEAILVYDVSRWGRFQDADQSAYYEFLCRRAGIAVHYCAEQFENDGSLSATIIKSMKRAMAGEYSRELSAKVFTGQCRLITLGFRQGGPAGFGLRRQLVDEHRQPKAELARGEHKSLQTDRVVLKPGPAEEVEIVRRIYRMFVLNRRSEREIAILLNAEGILTDLGRAWTRGTVHQVLTNEKYIGNNVYNRVSFKLKQQRVINPPGAWIRAEGAFEPIVETDSLRLGPAETLLGAWPSQGCPITHGRSSPFWTLARRRFRGRSMLRASGRWATAPEPS